MFGMPLWLAALLIYLAVAVPTFLVVWGACVMAAADDASRESPLRDVRILDDVRQREVQFGG